MQQKLFEFDQQKWLMTNEFHHLLRETKLNLTDTIHQVQKHQNLSIKFSSISVSHFQLSIDNEKLHEQMIALEHRLQTTEEQRSKKKEECPEGSDVSKITSMHTCLKRNECRLLSFFLRHSVCKFTGLGIGCCTRSFNQTNGFNR